MAVMDLDAARAERDEAQAAMLREDEAWNALLRRAWELFLSEWGGQPEQYGTFVRAVYAFDLAREAG